MKLRPWAGLLVASVSCDAHGVGVALDACVPHASAERRAGAFGQRPGPTNMASPPSNFATIQAGVFAMGSPDDETGRSVNERFHRVYITRDYEILRWHVKQSEWEAVMATSPQVFDGCPDCPVENVSWNDATNYADALSAAAGLTQCYTTGADPITDCDGYRLLTEAEHEYAMRAGNTGTAGVVSDATCTYHAANNAIGWHCGNADCLDGAPGEWTESGGGYCPENPACVTDLPIIDCNNTQPACLKDVNANQVCDWGGNVFDWLNDQECTVGNSVDPDGTFTINGTACAGPAGNAMRKGGSIKESPQSMRPALRTPAAKTAVAYNVGLRVGRTVDLTPATMSSALVTKELDEPLTWDFMWRGSNCPAAASAFVSTEGSQSVAFGSGTWSCDQTTTSLNSSALDGEADQRIASTAGCWTSANPFTLPAASDVYVRFVGRVDRPASGNEYLFRVSQGGGEYLYLEIQSSGAISFQRNTTSSDTGGFVNGHTLAGAIPAGGETYMVIDAFSDGEQGHMYLAATQNGGANTVWGGTPGTAAFGSHENGNFGLFGAQGSCTTAFTGGILSLGLIFDSPWYDSPAGPWQTPVSTQWSSGAAFSAMCSSPPCT